MAVRKGKEVERLRAALRAARSEPATPEVELALRQSLAQDHWLVVMEAAELVGERLLAGFEADLSGVFGRFSENGAKRDPGCRAKQAALTALDRLEGFDAEPFLPAIRYRQLEPVYGKPADTAGGVRARALYALCRLRHPDAVLHAGELLADADAGVRSAVVHALGYYGDRASAGLLVHKLRAGDDEPNVLSEAAVALLAVARDFALPLLSEWLARGSEAERECAALALGQCRALEAVQVLIDWIEASGWDREQSLGVRALGASRLPEARTYLLRLVAGGSPALARAAVEALAVHRYDAELARSVAEAAGRSRVPDLAALASRLFRASDES